MTEKDKLKKVGDILLNNAMYIIIAATVVYIAIMRDRKSTRLNSSHLIVVC